MAESARFACWFSKFYDADGYILEVNQILAD